MALEHMHYCRSLWVSHTDACNFLLLFRFSVFSCKISVEMKTERKSFLALQTKAYNDACNLFFIIIFRFFLTEDDWKVLLVSRNNICVLYRFFSDLAGRELKRGKDQTQSLKVYISMFATLVFSLFSSFLLFSC